MINTEIVLIRLLNGIELLGEISYGDKDGDTVLVKKPVRVVVMPSQTNPSNPTVGFAPWCEFTTDEIVEFRNDHVLATMTPIPEFVAQYKRATSSVILPDNQRLIVP